MNKLTLALLFGALIGSLQGFENKPSNKKWRPVEGTWERFYDISPERVQIDYSDSVCVSPPRSSHVQMY